MKYIDELKKFKAADSNESNLDTQFEDLANYFLTKGYFRVNEKRRVYICDVEFYYHEEDEGGIKDWIMYHRNKTNSKGVIVEPDYFEMGQLNAHNSGIDITFENEKKKYRAGMLIRGFKIVDAWPLDKDDSILEYDKRSTYVYEAMLNCGNIGDGITIDWVEEDNYFKLDRNNIVNDTRQNVAEYECENTRKEATGGGSIAIGGKRFKQCSRKWRYKLK